MSLQSLTKLASIALLSAALFGCRGSESKKPPIHLNPNMDVQEKYKAQEESKFFADGRTMRTPVEGTIPMGDHYARNGADYIKHDSAFYKGVNEKGEFVTLYPSLDKLGFKDVKSLLARGQERYNIFCAPCHSETGDALGHVAERGFPGVVPLNNSPAKDPGYYYSKIIQEGGVMPSYAYQIKVRDRWAIVAYLKVLRDAAQDPNYKTLKSYKVVIKPLEPKKSPEESQTPKENK